MDAFLSQVWAREITGWAAFGGLAILVVVSVIRGWLIPGKTHERELATERKRGDEWKETAKESAAQNAMLVQANVIVKDFFQKVSVDRNTSGDGSGGNRMGEAG